MKSNQKEQPNNTGHNRWWFVLGAAAGIAAGYYLNSDNGRKMRKEAGNQIADYGDAISKRASGSARHMQSYAHDIGEAIRQRLDSLSETTESIRHRLENQIHSGKKVLRGKARKIENEIDERLN